MAQETKQSPVPLLCATGCGFYGSPRTDGMCSVCYKEHLQRQQNNGRGVVSPSPAADSTTVQRGESLPVTSDVSLVCASDASVDASAATLPVTQQMTEMSISREDCVPVPEQPVVTQPKASACPPSGSCNEDTKAPDALKAKKNRCFMCRKKVGLTGFDCRCGNLFCGLHRYSDKHNCPYDYRAEAAEKIRKENPVVVADKIQRI